MRRVTAIAACLVGASIAVLAQQNPGGPTAADLLAGLSHAERWVTYSGDYTGQRHSPLTAITPANVHQLAARWTFQTGTMTRGRGFEATPLAWDGVLYVTGSNNFAWALDGRTGRPFWQYRRDLPANLTYGAQAPVNRGFAMLGDRLFMVTLDAHLLAFDRTTGTVLWDLSDAICGPTACPALVPGDDGRPIVVYRDDHHLSARYAARLAPAMGQAWDAAPPRR